MQTSGNGLNHQEERHKGNNLSNGTRRTAVYGLLTALALILSYVEAQFPVLYAIPGIKLGLTNLVVLIALYRMSEKSAFVINLVRILIAGFLFGSGVSILYSLAGGMLSTLIMILLKRKGKFGMTAVSAAGGVSHNAGQLIAAMLLLGSRKLAWYLVVLWFVGIGAGLVIGLLGGLLVRHLPADWNEK